MTEENKTVTVAGDYETAEKIALRAIHDVDGRGLVGAGRNHLHQRVARAILQHEAALRRELDEARDRHAISQSVAGDMASALDDARADIAKKDAALREAAKSFARMGEVYRSLEALRMEKDMFAALAPAAQGEYSPEQWTEYQRQHTAANPLNVARAAAPAPSAGGTLNEGAVAALASYQQGDADGVMVLVSRQAIDECLPHLRTILAAAPTTGEPT